MDNCNRGIWIVGTDGCTVENNTITNSLSSTGILIYTSTSDQWVSNVTVKNNIVRDSAGSDIQLSSSYGDIYISNILFINNSINKQFESSGNNISNITVRDLPDSTRTFTINTIVSDLQIEFTDGKMFSDNCADNPYWYPDQSNITLTGTGTISLTTYNITSMPTSAHLKDVTVNHESNSTDDRTNITINSTVSNNPAWINATMQNASNTYNVSIDGGYVTQVVSDSDKIVRYKYTDLWSSHDFEFDWYSTEGGDGWTPSNQGIYWNPLDPIEITRNATINIFSRIPQQSDNNATSSFSMKVTTA